MKIFKNKKNSKYPVHWKDTFRTIGKSKKRFVAILLMTMLGAMVFIGLISSGPNFRRAVNRSVFDTNRDHIRASSLLGLYPEDKELLENLDDLKAIEYIYSGNFLIGSSKKDVIQIQSLTKNISTPLIVEGKAPEKSGQILLDIKAKDKLGIKISDKISINPNTEKNKNNNKDENDEDIKIESPLEDDLLKRKDFEVVGFAKHINYMVGSSYGPTKMGNGSIKYFGLVLPEDFDKERFNTALIQVNSLDKLLESSKEYKIKEQEIVSHIEDKLSKRPDKLTEDLKKDANKSIKNAEDDLTSAKDELKNGEKELKDAREKLDKAWQDFENGREQFKKKIEDGISQLTDASEKLSTAKAVLDEGEEKYDKGLADYNKGLVEAQKAEKLLISTASSLNKAENDLYLAKKELTKRGINWNFVNQSQKKLDLDKEALKKAYSTLDKLGLDLSFKDEFLKTSKSFFLEDRDRLLKEEADLEEKIKNLEAEKTSIEKKIGELELEKDKLEKYPSEKMPDESLTDENIADEDLTDDELSITAGDKGKESLAEPENSDNKKDILEKHEEYIEDTDKKEEVQVKGLFEMDLEDKTLAIENLDKKISDLKEKLEIIDSEKESLSKDLQNIRDKKSLLDKALKALSKEEIPSSVNTLKDFLADKSKELDKLQADLDKAKAFLNQIDLGEKELEKGWLSYNEGLESYKRGLEKLVNVKNTLDNSSARLSAGFKEYYNGLDELERGRNQLENARREGLLQLEEGERELNKGEADYQEGLSKFEKEKIDAEEKIADGEEKIAAAKNDVEDIRVPAYTIAGLYNDFTIRNVLESGDNMDTLTMIFPAVFYLIAMLTTLTTITRMVDEERSQIGSKKALGMSKKDIMSKYLSYAFFSSILGTILGIIGGFKLLMPVIFDAYMGDVKFVSALDHKLSISHILIALLIGVGVNLFSAWWSVHKDLKENAASLMRPKPPAKGNRILVERINFLWKKLSFTQKVTFRNLTAKKSRMFMSLLGVLSGTALIVMGFGLRNSINQLIDKQFDQIERYNTKIFYNPKADYKELEELEYYLDTKADYYTKLHTENAKFENKKKISESFILEVVSDKSSYLKTRKLRDRKSGEEIPIPKDKALISDTMARMLGADDKNTLRIKDEEGYEESVAVGESFEQYIQHFMVMSPELYKKIFEKDAEDNSYYVNFQDKISAEKAKDELLDMKAVSYAITAGRSGDEIDNFKNAINVVVGVISIVSSLLAFVVLYNLTNLNVSERQKEISTIKVLGFHNKEVTEYIYKETFILTIIGLLLGCLGGRLLHYVICTALSPSTIILDPELKLSAYLYGVGIISIFSVVVMYLIHRQLKNVDMVEALKADE